MEKDIVTEGADPSSVSSLRISTSPKLPRTPRSPLSPKPLLSPRTPKSPRSPKSPVLPVSPHSAKVGTSKGSPLKSLKHSYSSIDGRPKKGGCGGKGTWGGLLDVDDCHRINPHDPNYSSAEEKVEPKERRTSTTFEDYKKKVTIIVEEYFATDDITSAANELGELGMPYYNFYFVKKLISIAMDRHDKEKEMAAILLSSLYADVIEPLQVYKGFRKLLESVDDLIVDIPDAVDVLSLFLARAVVDDILPPAFLTKNLISLPNDSKGVQVINRAEKSYLSAPLHAEIIERRWTGNKNRTVEDVKDRINNLLTEFVASGDKKEAFRCIKDLNVPFFHHEIVKRAVIMAMEKRQTEHCLLALLKTAAEEGLINSSQISKGYGRIIDNVDDLSLDIPNAKGILQSLISKAASEGWLSASSLKSYNKTQTLEDHVVKAFKIKTQSIIQEYFLSGDISEVSRCLEIDNSAYNDELNAIFVKKLITLAMDRKNREKEMAAILLSSLCLPSDDVGNGFVMLIESADDTALDNPVIVDDLAMFLARAEVDEVISPQHLEEIANQCPSPESVGYKVIQMTKSLLKARLSGERILRCWGGGGSGGNGWDIDDVKDKIGKLLEEYESGGDTREACRCIKELGMPFFHHEVVKKSLVCIMEKRNEKLWKLLKESFNMGLITMYQMMKGFSRVAESLDDLALDVPDVTKQFKHYVERATEEGWLDSSFHFDQGLGHALEKNASC